MKNYIYASLFINALSLIPTITKATTSDTFIAAMAGVAIGNVLANAAEENQKKQAEEKASLLKKYEAHYQKLPSGSFLEKDTNVAHNFDTSLDRIVIKNNTNETLTIELSYNMMSFNFNNTACKDNIDQWEINPHEKHTIHINKCHPTKCIVYTPNKIMLDHIYFDESHIFAIDIIPGPHPNTIFLRDTQFARQTNPYCQWIENTLPASVKVILVYRSAFCPNDDTLIIQGGGNGKGNPQACLLKKIIVKKNEQLLFERQLSIGAKGVAHGSWKITPQGIEGPLIP